MSTCTYTISIIVYTWSARLKAHYVHSMSGGCTQHWWCYMK